MSISVLFMKSFTVLFTPPPSVSVQHPSRQEGAHWPCHLCLHHHRLFQCNILLDRKVLTDLAIFVYTTIVCFSATSFWAGRCSLTLPSLFTPPSSVSVQHPSRQEGAHWPCHLCLHHHRLFQCNILLDGKVLTDLAIFVYTTTVCFSATSF